MYCGIESILHATPPDDLSVTKFDRLYRTITFMALKIVSNIFQMHIDILKYSSSEGPIIALLRGEWYIQF